MVAVYRESSHQIHLNLRNKYFTLKFTFGEFWRYFTAIKMKCEIGQPLHSEKFRDQLSMINLTETKNVLMKIFLQTGTKKNILKRNRFDFMPTLFFAFTCKFGLVL